MFLCYLEMSGARPVPPCFCPLLLFTGLFFLKLLLVPDARLSVPSLPFYSTGLFASLALAPALLPPPPALFLSPLLPAPARSGQPRAAQSVRPSVRPVRLSVRPVLSRPSVRPSRRPSVRPIGLGLRLQAGI